MPIGTPSVPYRLPGSQYERWVDIYTRLGVERILFLGSEVNDAIQLYKGKDVVVGGGGSDAILMDSSINKSKKLITLDREGSADATDDLILAKGALKSGKAKIVISDYNFRNDTINLETKPNKVKGIGTEEIKISTKNGKRIIIESDGTKIKRSGIEFI